MPGIGPSPKLVEETSRTGILSLANLGKYHRDFVAITMFLIMKNCLATHEQSCTFACAFPPELWSQVSYQLQLQFPDHFPDDPYPLEQIHNAACFVLHGTTASAPTLTSPPKTKTTKLSILIDTMKQFVTTLDNQTKPSALTNLLLVCMPSAPPVHTFQLSLQACIQEIEKELLALRSQVLPCEQATLKPPATHKMFVPVPMPALAANSIPMPMPALKGRCTLVPTPTFDDTPGVMFVSCPTTSTLKAAHAPVFCSVHPTSKTANIGIFALAPSATITISRLVPEYTAPAEHTIATSRSVSILTTPSCAFASAETSLTAAHTGSCTRTHL